MTEDEEPEKDDLAIPDTRPNMALFVPFELAVLFVVSFFIINTITKSMVNGFVIIPVWIVAATLVRRDLNGVRVFFVRMKYMKLYFDSYRWGGLSVSPYKVRKKR